MTGEPALILLDGDIPEPALVRRLAARGGPLICADGAARHAIALRLEPDFVVGDMDSVPRKLPRAWRKTVYWCDFDEDRSDFEKALGFARDIGCAGAYVAGVLGGRIDHSLVNMAVAAATGRRWNITLVDRGLAQLLGPGTHRLALPRGKTFSLLAAGPMTKVTLSGAKYPLKSAALPSSARGLSNVAAGPVRLTVHRGWVWAMAAA